MKITALLLPLLLLLMMGKPPIQHKEKPTVIQTTSTLEGTVTINTGQQHLPIANATVSLKGTHFTTVTDSNGYYRLENVPAATYEVAFSAHGYFPTSRKDIRLWSNQTTRLHVQLNVIEEPVKEIEILEVVEDASPEMMPAPAYQQQHTANRDDMMAGEMGVYYKSLTAGGNEHESIHNTEAYDFIRDNSFFKALNDPLSTFSIDVDNASYSNMRRFLAAGQEPPKDAIRIEELVNYFDYDYTQPQDDVPFSIYTEVSDCPWNMDHKLVHIGLQGKQLDYDDLQPSNLVFLIDVSGSMGQPNKLPLVKSSLLYLADQMGKDDRISIVVYAGAAGLVLPSTPASDKATIRAALDQLQSGGSTAGGAGLRLAYKTARDFFIEGGNNRVILATDGDFNVGQSSDAEMIRLIEEERKSGVYITVLGFGMGNYKDSKMEKIAQYGNGNYFYIDKEAEAQKVFGKELRATLFTIAADVKIQVEFNPAVVAEYRLVGYENRVMDNQDFEDDTKDAGELGAGHTVTALYEVVLVDQNGGQEDGRPETLEVKDLKYQQSVVTTSANFLNEMMTVKLRYKQPGGTVSRLIEAPVKVSQTQLANSSNNFRWSAGVALFGMMLRDSEFKGNGTFDMAVRLARGAKGADPDGLRQEFIDLAAGYVQQLAAR